MAVTRLRWGLGVALTLLALIAAARALGAYVDHRLWLGSASVVLLGVIAVGGLWSLAEARRRIERELGGLGATPPGGELWRARRQRLEAVRAVGATPDLDALAAATASEERGRAYLGRYLVAVTVLVGLVGTFAGLMETLRGVAPLLRDDHLSTMQALALPLAGLDVTFGASVVGILVTLALSLVQGDLVLAEEQALARLEEMTAHRLVPELWPAAARADERLVGEVSALRRELGELMATAHEATAQRIEAVAATLQTTTQAATSAVAAAVQATTTSLAALAHQTNAAIAEASRAAAATQATSATQAASALERTARETATALQGTARETAAALQGTARETVAVLQSSLRDATAGLEGTTRETSAALQNTAEQTSAVLQATAERASSSLRETAEQASASLQETAQRASSTLQTTALASTAALQETATAATAALVRSGDEATRRAAEAAEAAAALVTEGGAQSLAAAEALAARAAALVEESHARSVLATDERARAFEAQLRAVAETVATAAGELRAGATAMSGSLATLTPELNALGREVALLAARAEAGPDLAITDELVRLGDGLERLEKLLERERGRRERA